MSSKTFKPLEVIRKHRLDKATLELTKARRRLSEAENNVNLAKHQVEVRRNELLQCFARLSTLGETELIEVVRARYAIDEARDAIVQAEEHVNLCEAQREKLVIEVEQARTAMVQSQRSLDAMEIIIGRMKEEETEAEFTKEEELVEDLAMARSKK
jgi:alpha-D-ribose 1-methylphosphonate 5-triphosphate synthase subunit PhnL